jgi:hypothetical protein
VQAARESRLSSRGVFEATMPTPLRRAIDRAAATAATASALTLTLAAPPALAIDCPGALPACPYVSGSLIGQRGGGVLRFPQAVAIGPDGSVYVGDQSSSVVQVFSPSGAFLREVGVAGTRPGELGAVGAIAVAADNTLFVAEGTNRIDRFDGAAVPGSASFASAPAAADPRRPVAAWRSPATASTCPTASTTASSASTSTAAGARRSSLPGCSRIRAA